MSRHSYVALIIIILVTGAFALLWPDFVLEKVSLVYYSVAQPEEEPVQEKKAFEKLDEIDFAITPEDRAAAAVDQGQKSPVTTDQNRLVIPVMGVDAEVIVSDSDSALRQGLWHIPGSAFPAQNGNIVIAAHRWLYRPPSPKTFFLIDKMKKGDPIYYDYQGSRYTYKVTSIDIVDPDDVHILAQDKNKLTLFTCHPLYSTKQRFEVSAQ